MRRPWNLTDLPVYSLATYTGDAVNMNICTYVTAVSMQPKMYAIAVYKGSRTLDVLQSNRTVVLQLLQSNQYGLIRCLGKQSGHEVNKQAWLAKRDLLMNWQGFSVLKGAAAWMQMHSLDSCDSGDHVLFTFRLLQYKVASDDILTTGMLREKKITRA